MTKKWLTGIVAALTLLVLTACGNGNRQVIAGGSTALQPLVQQAATRYMRQHTQKIIMVQGGGSGVGLAQVLAGSFQIGNSDIFAEEKPGIDASRLTDNKVAVTGFAPVVNARLHVTDLSVSQLTDIFTGKITNWSQLGGQNLKITVIGRTEGSGTRVNFDKYGLNGATELNGPTQDASGSVVQLVSQTPGAISYLAFAYMHKAGIKPLKLAGVAPTDSNVTRNVWKIWAYEHMYTKRSRDNSFENGFISYVKRDHADLRTLGYIPVSAMTVDRAADGTISKR